MEMCYDGALVMPSSYAVMNDNEMTYVEGGSISVATVCTIIATAIGVSGATYGAGKVVGQRLYYRGITTSAKWSKCKWAARAAATAISPVFGSIFMLGVENQLYSMITGR